MTLHDKNVVIGNFLFRWRSYVPLAFIVILLPGILEAGHSKISPIYDLTWEMVCLSVSFFGILIRCYTIGYTPKGTSGRNTKKQVAETLNTTGIYSIIRNPLYFGNFFIGLGITMFVHVWWVSLIYALLFWLYYERIILAEEDFLTKKFGEEYFSYAEKTPVFIPNFKLWKSNMLPFSYKNFLKREYSGFFAVIVAFTIMEVAENYVVFHRVTIEPVWLSLFISGLLVYIIIRIFKKNTGLLYVEGR